MSKARTPTWGRALKRAEQSMLRAKGRALKASGLTLAQYVVLDALETEPGITAAALARACFVTPQAMVVVLKALEQGELVTREPHPRHPSVLELRLSDAGQSSLEQARRLIAPLERRMAEALSSSEAESLTQMLTRVAEALETPVSPHVAGARS